MRVYETREPPIKAGLDSATGGQKLHTVPLKLMVYKEGSPQCDRVKKFSSSKRNYGDT